jgi:hypothetical protein
MDMAQVVYAGLYFFAQGPRAWAKSGNKQPEPRGEGWHRSANYRLQALALLRTQENKQTKTTCKCRANMYKGHLKKKKQSRSVVFYVLRGIAFFWPVL